jgi:signal transduction histidine kinase/CheY-like chemotaxis protein
MSDDLTVQIDELVGTATAVSATRDSTLRAAKLSDDELGQLALAFNEMLSQIAAQQRELEMGQSEREGLLVSERAARAEAERASKMKDEFVATLSHELRTPLTPILGWVNVLGLVGPRDEQTRHGLEVIERNAKLQARMIDDLLEMSRIVSGKLRLDVQPVLLDEVVGAAVSTVRQAADQREIRLSTELEAGIGRVQGDAGRLQQVVWNLLSNAIKFTPTKGRVVVSLSRRGAQAEIVVRDTGQGIDADLLPHVFERFRQGDSSTTRQHGGLGLGLAIARQLIEMHGGTIRAASDGPGLGSTFTVTLPLHAADIAPSIPVAVPAPAAASAASRTLQALAILVVDDDTDVRELLKKVLETGGAEVELAASAEEALAAFDERPWQLLISDIGMPRVDGYELIRRIREREALRGGSIPAIALTAFARSEDRLRALAAGYQLHLAKPIEPEALLAAATRLAGPARARPGSTPDEGEVFGIP